MLRWHLNRPLFAHSFGSVSGAGIGGLTFSSVKRPSLHDLLWPSLAVVRPLRWYYAAVRLPAAVHVGLMAHRFLPPIRQHQAADGNRVSRFSRVKFPYMRGVCDSAVPVTRSRLRVPHVAFRLL